jgi:hypothetical protein
MQHILFVAVTGWPSTEVSAHLQLLLCNFRVSISVRKELVGSPRACDLAKSLNILCPTVRRAGAGRVGAVTLGGLLL